VSILCIGIQLVDLNIPSIQQVGGKHGNVGMGMEIGQPKDMGQSFSQLYSHTLAKILNLKYPGTTFSTFFNL